MPGAPKKRAMIAELERRTRAEFGDQPATHFDYAEYRVAGGTTLEALSQELSISREMLRRYLYEQVVDAEQRLSRARAEGAHGLAEQSIEDLNGELATSTDVARASAKARAKQWLAERWNKRELGQEKGTTVSISIGGMHLDSLRRRGKAVVVVAPSTPALGDGLTSDDRDDAQVVDAELLSE